MTSSSGGSLSFSVTKTSTGAALQTSKKFKPFTEGNYRDNLKILTGTNPPRSVDAHHVFAQKFRDKFAEKGVNIDNPKYLTWWKRSPHRQSAYDYNLKWDRFMFKNPEATESQILEQGRTIMSQFGQKVNY